MSVLRAITGRRESVESMNISEHHVPDWGDWEVGREIISNAWDADGRYQVDRRDDDCIIVTSRGVPEWRHLTVIGAGTKTVGDGNIGQFREGFKFAAMVATRAGGSVTVELPDRLITFELIHIDGLDERVLHVAHRPHVAERIGYCVVIVEMPGIGNVTRGRILRTRKALRMEKQHPDRMRVFRLGVWVADLERPSLYDWSLPSIEVDRDRRLASEVSIECAIVRWMNGNLDDDMAHRIVAHPDTFEAGALSTYQYLVSGDVKKRIAEAFTRQHGPRAVVAEGGEINAKATETGRVPVATSRGVALSVSSAAQHVAVPMASTVVPIQRPSPEFHVTVRDVSPMDFAELEIRGDVSVDGTPVGRVVVHGSDSGSRDVYARLRRRLERREDR